jgi:hypothetical protein
VPQSSVLMSGQSNSVALECDCLAHRFGNAGGRSMRERRYPSDMTDAEWTAVREGHTACAGLAPGAGWAAGGLLPPADT